MQVIVEQELEVEELPKTLQVTIVNNSLSHLSLSGGAFGLASCEGGEGGEGHGHVVWPPPGGRDHSQFWRGGLNLEVVRTILNSGGVA